MYTKSEEILNIVKKYVTDHREKQAIMLDGAWGIGKTYFAKHILMKELEQSNRKHLSTGIIYVSLYGVNSTDDILTSMYQNLLESMFSIPNTKLEKRADKAPIVTAGKIGLKLLSSAAMSTANFLSSLNDLEIPNLGKLELSDVLAIDCLTVIFDDLERCNINLCQVMGFINNLVEHNGVKAVLIANENELLKLCVDEKEQENYKNIKEKLLGKIIKFSPSFEDLYDVIVDENCTVISQSATPLEDEKICNNIKEIMMDNKDQLVGLFYKYEHLNFRTLSFAILSFECIYKVIYEIKVPGVSSCTVDEAKQVEYRNILVYLVSLSIHLKKGEDLPNWNRFNFQHGYIKKASKDETTEQETILLAYQFVDIFLCDHVLDNENVQQVMEERLEIVTEELAQKNNMLTFHSLEDWRILSDVDINRKLETLKPEVAEDKYHFCSYCEVLYRLLAMQRTSQTKENIFEIINLISSKLSEQLPDNLHLLSYIEKNSLFRIQDRWLDVDSSYDKFLSQFLLENTDLFNLSIVKLNEMITEHKADWGNCFNRYIEDLNKNPAVDKEKITFFLSCGHELIVQAVFESDNVDIVEFSNGLVKMYEHKSDMKFLKFRLKDDMEELKTLIQVLKQKIEESSEHSRNSHIENLIDALERIGSRMVKILEDKSWF